jgi:hypothetical protein
VLPPLRNEKKRNRGSKCCPRSKRKERGGSTCCPCSKRKEMGAAGAAPIRNGKKQGQQVLPPFEMKNKKKGRRRHERPPPSLAVSHFPCLLAPHSPASPLHVLSPSLLLPPTHRFPAPTSLEGRGSRCDLSAAVVSGDVASGCHQRR